MTAAISGQESPAHQTRAPRLDPRASRERIRGYTWGETITALLGADLATVLLLDHSTGDLVPHETSAIGREHYSTDIAYIRANTPDYAYIITQTQHPFYSGHASHNSPTPRSSTTSGTIIMLSTP